MVNRSTLKDDVIAGFTGSILGLPQGVAFAILAGLPPQYGLYAAMIPPALSALFGSSWHMVAGPTNAVAILLFASLGHFASPGSADYINLGADGINLGTDGIDPGARSCLLSKKRSQLSQNTIFE